MGIVWNVVEMPLVVDSKSGTVGYGRILTGAAASTKGSLQFDGQTSFLTVANDVDFQLGTGDFTAEWFQWMNNNTEMPTIFSQGAFANNGLAVTQTMSFSTQGNVLEPGNPIYVWPVSSIVTNVTDVTKVIDRLSTTKYTNPSRYEAGFIVRPNTQTIVNRVAFMTANDKSECDPLLFTIEGTNEIQITPFGGNPYSISYTPIATNISTNCSLSRLTKSFSAYLNNTVPYSGYRVRFPQLRNDLMASSILQLTEVEMEGSTITNQAQVVINGSTIINSFTGPALQRWSHFALQRLTNTVSLFQDGALLSTAVNTYNLTNNIDALYIGKMEDFYSPISSILITTPTYERSAFSTMSGGTIQNIGSDPVFRKGLVWNSTINPTVSLSTQQSYSGISYAGSYPNSITGLLPSTQYYARSFATSAAGTGYGNQIAFVTDPWVPYLSTTQISSISTGISFVFGTLETANGSTVTTRGFVWSLLSSPTIELSTQTRELGTFGTGLFSSLVSSLNAGSTYYFRSYGINGVGIGYGNELSSSSGLYLFTTFTFTNANKQGAFGPVLSECRSAYVAQSWTQNSAYFNMITQGIQRWTVPRTGTYQFEVAGATGGSPTSPSGTARPGYGYIIRGTLALTEGEIVNIVVGQRGVGTLGSPVQQAGGGGGASCVFIGSTLHFIAAGGNGQSWSGHTVADPDGRGTGQTVSVTSQGRGYQGATFSANGDGGSNSATAILNGAIGGNPTSGYASTGSYGGQAQQFAGGFGGGGGTNPYEGGGGCGYVGGVTKPTNQYTTLYPLQGAVSFMSGSVTNQTNIGTNTSGATSNPAQLHGYVSVTLVQ